MNVALFDYGAGNLHSLGKGLEAAGAVVTVTSDWDEAVALDALVKIGTGPAQRAPARPLAKIDKLDDAYNSKEEKYSDRQCNWQEKWQDKLDRMGG